MGRNDDLTNNATVENCTFTGSKSPTVNKYLDRRLADHHDKDNSFLNSPEDSIALQQGLVTGNYFSGEGYLTGAHGDAIYVPETTGPVIITDNFIDETANSGATGFNNTDIRITDEGGDNTSGVTATGNYMFGAGLDSKPRYFRHHQHMSNVSFANNYVGFNWL